MFARTTSTALPALFSLLLLTLFTLSATAAPVPAPPSVAATGHLLIDFDSGHVLAENNAEQRLEPASLTKIMTAYVVMKEIQAGQVTLQDQVLVSKKAWRTPGSRMFIEVGEKIALEVLLKGMIIQSGNDASVALAEHVAGSEETFANLMNDHAKRLGMANTHFVNSTGLPHAEHYTTPRDIARVTRATIREFPDIYQWYATKEFTFNSIRQHNRNKLLWRDDAVDGVKTGHTEAAGYCLVASAKKDGMRLIAVVMGTRSEEARASESLSLLNYGFRFFETHRLYGAGEKLTDTRVWKGSQERLRLGLARDLYITIPRGQYPNLNAGMRIDPQIMAPVTSGQPLGTVSVSLDGESIVETELVALDSIVEGGLVQIAKDTVLLWLE
ncbi:D-alanyl-D-alanine carboxypeptidase family protein [Sedimenticola hydrogenitrophicus]|uniref:D-alanyl-D-alanine carboxypeptidase family protein n=1 Tax=Sedimenticola hydrogenitrophicus TaxID=2967975 RepID=UPI0021A83598|nr:D-alanyl-D-alanine carboxypeptidase family protein [Sedimenticola hydrogenitrophicus]